MPAAAAVLFAACTPATPASLSTRDVVLVPGAGLAPSVLYARIDNPAAAPDTLIRITLGTATPAMLHVSAVAAGRATMNMVENAAVPARGTLWLAPGGLHAMIDTLEPRPVRGDSVRVSFAFAHAGERKTFAHVIDYSDVDSRTHRMKDAP